MTAPEVWVIVIAAAIWCGFQFTRSVMRGFGLAERERKRFELRMSREVVDNLIQCRACDSPLAGHSFWEPITIVLSDDETGSRIKQLVRRHEWRRVREFQIFNPEADALSYWFVECPQTNKGVLYEIHSKAGFDENDRIDLLEILSPSDTADFVRDLKLRERRPRLL